MGLRDPDRLFPPEPVVRNLARMLDASTLSRELAPLAGAYPAHRLGPPWWFFDSPERMRRSRELTTETADFYNTVGFNDDCAFLATLVATGRLAEDEARELAPDLGWRLAKEAYRL